MMDKKYICDIWAIVKDILKSAVWSSRWSKLISVLIAFLSLLGTIATLTGTSARNFDNNLTFLSTSYNWLIENVCILFLSILFLLLLRIIWVSAGFINEKNMSNCLKYTPIKLIRHLKALDSIFNKLINNQTLFATTLANTCDQLHEIIEKLTEKRCSVSIKLLQRDTSIKKEATIIELLGCNVQNVARDANHHKRDTADYNNKEHLIRENTAFSSIVGNLTKKTVYYLNNDVDINNGYNTSSPYLDENNNPINPPYKSELVLPIFQRREEGKYTFIGFLCIDCEDKTAFSKNDISFELANMTADKLFWAFYKYYNENK